MARDAVTAAGSPSGIADTAIAIATRSMSVSGSPLYTPRAVIPAAVAITSKRMNLAIPSMFLSNGVLFRTSVCSSSAIFPTSVSSPTDITIPNPLPETTVVLLNARFLL